MRIIIFDINPSIVAACKERFDGTDVQVLNCSIESVHADYIVTPGNTYGIMDGGLDKAVRAHFGQTIQDNIQWNIVNVYNGQLQVGESIFIVVMSQSGPITLIYAPTMKVPKTVEPLDIYYVVRKILNKLSNISEDNTVAFPGMGTLTGGVSPEDFADVMYKAIFNKHNL